MNKKEVYNLIPLSVAVLLSANVALAAEVTGTLSSGVNGSVGGSIGGSVGGGGGIGGTVTGGSTGGTGAGGSGGPTGGSVLGASTGGSGGGAPAGQVLGASTFNPGLPRTGFGPAYATFSILILLVVLISALTVTLLGKTK